MKGSGTPAPGRGSAIEPMSGITDVAEGSDLKLIDTLKKAAGVLRDEDLPYALAGGAAAYARGAMPPTHDVDFVIREADADAAARAFRARGMRVEIPPEGWLIKAYDDGRMIDLIFQLSGHLDMQAVLGRAEEINVAAVPMPVLTATDLVIAWLASFSEHHADFAGALSCVRIPIESVRPFRSNPYGGSGVFVHLVARL
jgi:hypothetical protein